MLDQVRSLLACNICCQELQRPVTLDCGHSVCARHPSPVCSSCPQSQPTHCTLPSGVAYYSAALTPSTPPPQATDVVLTNILDSCSRGPQAEDFTQCLLSELTCQVCFQLFVDPVTTPCQHTFCSDCIERSLDHHVRCPLCRQALPGFRYFANHPHNVIVQSISSLAFPEFYVERQLAISASQRHPLFDTAIFRCNLTFPGVPVFLHVFEPRYRLMIRRCLANTRPRFGMVMHSPPPSPGSQSPSPPSEPEEYGTMLEIRSVQMLPDGRSMVESTGVSRFKILDQGVWDGYQVARVEQIDDIESEEIGVEEKPPQSIDGVPSMSTAELMQYCQGFVQTLRTSTAPWVGERLDSTHGKPPDDPTAFSFWMASVLPIPEREKARLLPLRSPHARLALIVRWIEALTSTPGNDAGCVIS